MERFRLLKRNKETGKCVVWNEFDDIRKAVAQFCLWNNDRSPFVDYIIEDTEEERILDFYLDILPVMRQRNDEKLVELLNR